MCLPVWGNYSIGKRLKKAKNISYMEMWVSLSWQQSFCHTFSNGAYILFWKETLQAQCFYLQHWASVVFSVWEPKAAALQVNLPVWSQTGCTLGQGRGDTTCVWVNTVCVCVYSVSELAQPPLKSALETLDSKAQYYYLWDLFMAGWNLWILGICLATLLACSFHTLSFSLWRRGAFY